MSGNEGGRQPDPSFVITPMAWLQTADHDRGCPGKNLDGIPIYKYSFH